jgi:hypothetical protein
VARRETILAGEVRRRRRKMRFLSTVPLTILAVLLAAPAETCAQPFAKQVEVTNFPDPQNVTGAVEVTNLPDVQEVVGSVEVTNLPAASAPARFQLVGFTNETFDGATGVLGFTLACQQEFPNSRFCTTEEVMSTVSVPVGLVGDAWVRPIFISVGVDASGASGTIACNGWTQPSSRGMTVTPEGGFPSGGDNCDVARPIACCAPVE